jgi:hypothetical protein
LVLITFSIEMKSSILGLGPSHALEIKQSGDRGVGLVNEEHDEMRQIQSKTKDGMFQ